MANSEVIIKAEPIDPPSSSSSEPGSPVFGSPEPASQEYDGFEFPSPKVEYIEYPATTVLQPPGPGNDDEDYVPYSKRVTCSICNKTLANRTTLQKHLRIHTGEKPYPCLHCQRRFRQKEHRDKHTRIHTSGRGYDCLVCTMTFGRRHFLIKHMLQAHNTDVAQEQRWRDNFDSVLIGPAPSALSAGQSEHVFACNICGREFKHRYNLWRHVDRLHCRASLFHCEVCGKVFKKASALKVHGLIHTGQRPFQCITCLRSFSQKHHLLRHRLVHLPRSNLTCVLCRKSFRCASAFLEHMVMEHEGVPEDAEMQQCFEVVSTESPMPTPPAAPMPEDLECMFCNDVLCSPERLYVHVLQHCRELLGKVPNVLPLEKNDESRGTLTETAAVDGL